MKEFNDQLLKLKITKNKLKMEISLKDLVWLFYNSPANTYDGENIGAKVKPGKRQEFAEYIVNKLMDESPFNENNVRWGQPLEDIFEEILEGDEDFCKYSIDENE